MIIFILVISIIILSIISFIMYKYITDNIRYSMDEINAFLEGYCNKLETTPSMTNNNQKVFNSTDFKWTKGFRDNWEQIRNEFLAYKNKYILPDYKSINGDIAANTDGWKAVFLRAFNVDTKIIEKFPVTRSLINSCDCVNAFFSVLDPWTIIQPHYGIYKGVIRYHLGLIVPDDWENCFINIDGTILNWREGHDMMFDDLFLHHVENNTNQQRVILFLDIKRDFGNFFVNIFNNIFLKFFQSNDELLMTVSNANILNENEIDAIKQF